MLGKSAYEVGFLWDKWLLYILFLLYHQKVANFEHILYSSSYWTKTYSPSYGTCYTFNSANNPDVTEVQKASLTGVSNGLSIEVFIDQGNYMIKKLSKR